MKDKSAVNWIDSSPHWNTKKVIESNVFKGIKSFEDLQNNISKIKNTKIKGSAWEIFRKYYMTQIRGIKEFWYGDDIPIEILNELKIPTKDNGIDCVYRDSDGVLVAGQDKFRSDQKKIPWSKLSTFFGLAEYAPHRSILTNSKGVSDLVYKKDRWSLINDFSNIDDSHWKAIEPWLINNSKKEKVKPLERRTHQTKAVNSNVKMFNSGHDRLTNILPCGAGKTAIAIMTLKRLNPKACILFFPSVGLVNQTEIEFVKHHFNELYRYFAVTHDMTVTADMELYNDNAVDCEFPVTTNPEDLSSKIQEAVSQNKRILIFSTYHSSDVIAEACKGFTFDLGIFDEAHWTVGPRSKPYALGLSDSNIKIKKRLFLTATPTWNEGCPTLFNSMNNTDLYGVTNINMSFRHAIDQGIICDYELITPEVDSEDINRELINTSQVTLEGKLERSRLVSDCLSLRKSMKQFNFKKSFVFLNSCASARDFRTLFKEMYPEVECFYLDSKFKAHKRKQVINSFKKADKAILVNVDVLSEGIDCPNADCVFFAQPKSSVRLIMQAIGRVLRPYDDKDKAYVLISTYIQKNEEEDVSDALHESKYEVIGNVAMALAQYDEQWRELLERIIRRASLGGSDRGGDGADEEIEFPHLTYSSLTSSLFLRSILEVIPDHRTHFERLKILYGEHKNWDIIKKSNLKKYESKSFIDFLGNLGQRAKKPDSVLHDYYDWLQENNFPWPAPKKDKYHKEVFLPTIEEIKENLNSGKKYEELSIKLRTKLRDWKNNKTRSSEELEILEDALGLAWTNLPKYKFLEKIEEIKKDISDCTKSGSSSYKWLVDWKVRENELDEDMSLALNELLKDINTAKWGRKEEARLEEFYKKLEEWKQWKQNDFIPKDKKFYDGTGMKCWGHNMRAKLQDRDEYNNLTEEQKQDLIEAGFDKQIIRVKRYTAKEGIKLVNQLLKHKDFKNLPEELDMFVNAMRGYYRRWVNRTSHLDTPSRKRLYKSKNFRAIEEEINKKIPNFPWMPSKNKIIPKIKRTVQTSKAGTKCFSHSFSISFDGVCKTYRRKDSKLLEEMRGKLMEAGQHIDFPKPSYPKKITK